MPCCAARPTRASSIPTRLLVGSEFNGAYTFLKELNAGPDDLIPGVEMMAIRSDKNDKYSQPDGRFVGAPGKPTGVGYDSSELRGARNVDPRRARSSRGGVPQAGLRRHVRVHHRQAAGQPVHRPGAVAGAERQGHRHRPTAASTPTSRSPTPRSRSTRSTPRPASARRAMPMHRKTTGEDGLWGPFVGTLRRLLRVRAAPWRRSPITHTYRSPFLRSSDVVHLGPASSPRATRRRPPSSP